MKINFGTVSNPHIFPIDFGNPWWQLILKQKQLYFLIISAAALQQIFVTLTPFLVAMIFEKGSLEFLLLIFAAWFLIDGFQLWTRRKTPKFQLQCIYSIYQNAHSYFLSVDPQYHVHRSSGAVLGKIDRAARGYEEFLDHITDELTPLVMGTLTAIALMFAYSLVLAMIMISFIVAILIGGYFFSKYFCQPQEKEFIQSDDAFRTTAVENLAQVQLIRAAFATDFRLDQIKDKIQENIKKEGALWLSYISTFSILAILYLASLLVLSIYLMGQVKQESLATITAIALFLSYTQGTRPLVASIRIFRKLNRSLASIRDLFVFIPHFGKQNIPIDTSAQFEPVGNEIEASQIKFDYGKVQLFNDHSLLLNPSKIQTNKLYGIIGPSGSGKSTLLSILGGQQIPHSGTVKINGVDIYKVGDSQRRELIALQGQISSNLQGTIKSNLLLGMPHHHPFVDEDLLKILDDVGLSLILEKHEGLQTKIGEQGLNLSGGQRQRLNFASLYLRASYYRPALILIDEPTSSLDEISEAKITAMLLMLARSAVTLVIAHRLKTVEYAAGLIDLSLITQEREIKAYSSEELMRHSDYYRMLMEGKVALDS